MDFWHKETTPGTTGSRCTIRDGSGLFVAECIASDAATIAAAPAMLAALRGAIEWVEMVGCADDDPDEYLAMIKAVFLATGERIGATYDDEAEPIPSTPTAHVCPDCETTGVCEEHPFG